MPLPSEELWLAMNKEQDFNRAIKIIQSNPTEDLINSKSDTGCSLLMSALLSRPRPKAFIRFIIEHPKFDLAYTRANSESGNIESIIASADLEELQFALKNPAMYSNPSKLAYELASEELIASEKSLQTKLKKDPTSEIVQKIKTKIDDLKIKIAHIRDASIRYAVANDNDNLMDRLDAAGAKPADFLLDRTLPAMLVVKEKNPKILSWFRQGADRAAGRLSNNPNTLMSTLTQMNTLEQQSKTIEGQMLDEKGKIYRDGIQKMSNLLGSLTATMK